MAHAATLKTLTHHLVSSITGRSTEDAAFSNLALHTLKTIKDPSLPRTNQFAVGAKLQGLLEKFSVLHRDDLASALETDLNALPTDYRWRPDILALLLELSDRPLDKTSLADIDKSAENADPGQELTWDDIFAGEAAADPDLWQDVERGYHSSGDDEFTHDLDSEPTVSTTATSVDDDPAATAKLHLVQPDPTCLEPVKAARLFLDSEAQQDNLNAWSELTVIRETLMMLNGLPSDLYLVDEQGQVTLSQDVLINSASRTSLHHLLNAATATGTSINRLRQWVPDASYSYLQSIHASIENQLSTLGTQLALIEQQFLTPVGLATVSCLDVQARLDNDTRPLVQLSAIVESASSAQDSETPFALLDELYNEASLAHLSDDMPLFQTLAPIFLAGFTTYLRPVATWITKGTIVAQDRDVLFVQDLDEKCEAGQLWHCRFQMRLLPDGTPHTPCFFSSKAKTLFALGKSRAFLNELDGCHEDVDLSSLLLPDFKECLHQITIGTLAPFSQLLEDVLVSWISEISTDCSPVLRSKLFEELGLKRTLDALPTLFFSQNGILFQDFATTVIARMSSKDDSAEVDQFLLTELVQSTFGSAPSVSSDSIFVRLEQAKDRNSASSLIRKLASLTIGYRLSWPIQNAIDLDSPAAHSEAFTFMLQIYSAREMLRDNFFGFRSRDVRSAAAALRLRQCLIWFSGNMFDYTTKTARQIHKDMQQAMERAMGIDDMVAVFAAYSRRLQTNLLLSSKLEPVRDAILGILEVSELLSTTVRAERISSLQSQFDQSIRFLVAGIRGVGRAGSDSYLERLAESLEWGVH